MTTNANKETVLPLNNTTDQDFSGFSTAAIHGGFHPEDHCGQPAVLPITMSTTFQHSEPGVCTYIYSRLANPTRSALEKTIAALEHGQYCVTFGAGMGALDAFFHYLTSGDHVVCMDDVYGGTQLHFRTLTQQHNITSTFADMSDLENLRKALTPKTRLVWIETPSNPCMKLVDIREASKIIKAYKETNKTDIIFVVDNTFSSPYFQHPLELGADVSSESITKYINGHSDVIMGCMSTNNKEIYQKIKFIQEIAGLIPSPFDCYMVFRGLKTLGLRMRQHMANGLRIAHFLEAHPMVEKVFHPGLPSHPQYELAKRQMRGFGSTFSFILRGGLPSSRAMLKACKIFMCAVSLGGYESLIEHPALMTHATVPPEKRRELGIHDGFIRLSVGIEDAEDLIADLHQALEAAANAMRTEYITRGTKQL